MRELRADARRNHATLLEVARDVFVERGPDAPLDEIARRAGVGIGTLYRRFADRPTLMSAVVLDALQRTVEAVERARAENSDSFAALAAYMHDVIDLGTPAVIPTLLGHVALDDEPMVSVRHRSAAAVQTLIDDAKAAGTLRKDASFADIGLMLVRIARPLPGAIPPATQRQLAHRHVDLVLDALRVGGHQPLSGPALDRDDLQVMAREPR